MALTDEDTAFGLYVGDKDVEDVRRNSESGTGPSASVQNSCTFAAAHKLKEILAVKPSSASGRHLTQGAERDGFAMTAVPSNADVKKASLKAFTRAMGMSASVQVFGCLHDEAIHARQQQASEKRRGTKSRGAGHCGGSNLISGLWGFEEQLQFGNGIMTYRPKLVPRLAAGIWAWSRGRRPR